MRTSVILQRVILAVIGAAALVYAGDYLWAKHLMAGGEFCCVGDCDGASRVGYSAEGWAGGV